MAKLTMASSAEQGPPSPQRNHHSGQHQPHPLTPRSRPATHQPPPLSANSTNDTQQQAADDEHAALINEIRRLELSMNGALRASRDEMEILKETSVEKKAEMKNISEELEEHNAKMMTGDPQQRNNGGKGFSRHLSSNNSNSTGGRGEHSVSLLKSLRRQNSMLRRVSVSGDRPFFRHPPLKEELIHSESFFRRKSESYASNNNETELMHNDNMRFKGSMFRGRSMAANISCCDDSLASSSRQSSKGSKGSRSRRMQPKQQGRSISLRNLMNTSNGSNLNLPPCDSGDCSSSDGESDNWQNNDNSEQDVDEEELTEYEATLEAKEDQLSQLQKQHHSNSNQLSYLQSKLESIHTQSRSRAEQHASTVEGLNNRKQELARSIERREQLIKEAEESVVGHESMIDQLEKEIESKTNRGQNPGNHSDHDNDTASNSAKTSTASDVEEEIRKYQLRQKIHSQYTAKALKSFLNSMDMAKKKDSHGILFKTNHALEEEEEEEQLQHLIEGISLDADIQLNNLDRMIKEVVEKVNEYELLSSMELDLDDSSSLIEEKVVSSDDQWINHYVDDTKYNNKHNNGLSRPKHGNQLLLLSKECADLLADLLSTISKAMESTIRTTPHSLSIEFQPTTASSPYQDKSTDDAATNNDNLTTTFNRDDDDVHHSTSTEEDEELPYFQIQRKKLQLHEIQRSHIQVDSHISTLQNDARAFQRGMRDEKRVYYDIMVNLQTKLQTLTERLEDSGEEVRGLVNELETLKGREEGFG